MGSGQAFTPIHYMFTIGKFQPIVDVQWWGPYDRYRWSYHKWPEINE